MPNDLISRQGTEWVDYPTNMVIGRNPHSRAENGVCQSYVKIGMMIQYIRLRDLRFYRVGHEVTFTQPALGCGVTDRLRVRTCTGLLWILP